MTRALIVLILMSCCKLSHACFIQAEFKIEDIIFADAVFVGELVEYEIVKPKEDFDLSTYAILTFAVSEYIGGKLSEKRLEVYWHNSTFGMPSQLSHDQYLVAVTTNEQPPLRGPSATIFSSQRPDLPSVLQAPCADPFLLEPSKKNLERVKQLLKKQMPHNKAFNLTAPDGASG